MAQLPPKGESLSAYMAEQLWRRDVRAFTCAIVKHWHWWTCTTVGSGIAGFVQRGVPVIPSWILWLFAVSGILVAAFLAYRDQVRKAESITTENQQLHNELNYIKQQSATVSDLRTKIAEVENKVDRRGVAQSDEHLSLPIPVTGRSDAELALNQYKRNQMAYCLDSLRRRREDIQLMGLAVYESKLHGKPDEESENLIAGAAESVRLAFGDADAAVFRNDAGFPKLESNYQQIITRLERYEIKLREKIENFRP